MEMSCIGTTSSLEASEPNLSTPSPDLTACPSARADERALRLATPSFT